MESNSLRIRAIVLVVERERRFHCVVVLQANCELTQYRARLHQRRWIGGLREGMQERGEAWLAASTEFGWEKTRQE